MQRLHDQYPQMAILLIDSGEPARVALPYYQLKMLTVIIALDEDNQVNRAYRVHAIPSVFFIDGQGIIRKTHIGTMSETTIQEGLAAIGVK